MALWRRGAFDAWLADGQPEVQGLPALHLVARAGEEASAPFMTRERSATRSITQVRVDGPRGAASLTWWPRVAAAPIDPAQSGVLVEFALDSAAALLAEQRLT